MSDRELLARARAEAGDDAAGRAALAILEDCLDRRGIKNEFRKVAPEIIRHISEAWANIIRGAIREKAAEMDLLPCSSCGGPVRASEKYKDTGAGDSHLACSIACLNPGCPTRPSVVRFGLSKMTGRPGWVGGLPSAREAREAARVAWNTRLPSRESS